jgi:hypothetical protein
MSETQVAAGKNQGTPPVVIEAKPKKVVGFVNVDERDVAQVHDQITHWEGVVAKHAATCAAINNRKKTAEAILDLVGDTGGTAEIVNARRMATAVLQECDAELSVTDQSLQRAKKSLVSFQQRITGEIENEIRLRRQVRELVKDLAGIQR